MSSAKPASVTDDGLSRDSPGLSRLHCESQGVAVLSKCYSHTVVNYYNEEERC